MQVDNRIKTLAKSILENWEFLEDFDPYTTDISWHVYNMMSAIILLSEDQKVPWKLPSYIVIDDLEESELLSLYELLLASALRYGYSADKGILHRIRNSKKKGKLRFVL